MKSSKKLLSLFLAVVMVFSVVTVMASAYTVGSDIADGVNVKYTVEKVATVPANEAAGSEEYTAGNIFAVSIWMKASKGVDMFTAPVHYNKTKFAPITLVAEGATFPTGMEMDQDTYFTDMGEGTIYAYSLGDYMKNTGMYKANGDVASTKALAKCIGLGNSNSAGVTVTSELVSPDHTLYSKWGAGLPENTGVMYVNLDVQTNAKTAYLNTIEGVNYSTDWNKMFTVYFESLVDDVEGAEFGVYTDDCFKVEGVFDSTGSGYYVGATSYKAALAAANVSGNAKVAYVGHADTMAQWADQAAGKINVGLVGKFKVSDLPIAFDAKGTSENVTAVGAKVTINGTTEDKTTNFVYDVNGDGSEFWFRAVVEGVPYNSTEEISVVYYVVMDGRTYESAPVTTTGAAVYADAIANEMPEFGA